MRNFSLILIGVFLTGIAFTGCNPSSDSFTITNPSNVERTDEPIVLTRDMIKNKTGEINILEGQLPLPYVDEQPVPSQWDDLDGDGEWDELAFTLPISANSSKTISIQYVDSSEVPDFKQRTNVRFGILEDGVVSPVKTLSLDAMELPVPLFTRFQMDGPAWENDKVGFRQYIDGRNGRDLYGKKSSSMALDTVGIADDGTLEDNYHVMLPWGRDILAVGNSLGLGGLAIIEQGTPVRLGVRMDAEQNNIQTTTYDLVTEGPVRSIFTLTYEGWETPNGNSYDLENTVTIWAGSYGHTNKVALNSPFETDTLAVGVVNIHNDKEPTLLDDASSTYTAFYTHDQQTYDDEWYLGMGIIFPKDKYVDFTTAPNEGSGVTTSFLNRITLEEDKSLEYYVFAGWELSDSNFADSTYFDTFMKQEIQKKEKPVSIK